MCRQSQQYVMDEQFFPMWTRASRSCWGGTAPQNSAERVDHTPVPLQHGRDARAYILMLMRRPCCLADKCAPVSSNNPVRKAQSIRLADNANGP
jgi:hypothetical protein